MEKKKEYMEQDKEELGSWKDNCSFKKSGLIGYIERQHLSNDLKEVDVWKTRAVVASAEAKMKELLACSRKSK